MKLPRSGRTNLKVASADDDIAMLKLRGKVELIELLGAEALVTL